MQMHLVLTELSVSLKKAATNVSVPTECRVMPIRVDAFMRILKPRSNVLQTTIVPPIYTAKTATACHLALTCYVEQTLSANLRIMLVGAVAASDLLKARTGIVFRVRLNNKIFREIVLI